MQANGMSSEIRVRSQLHHWGVLDSFIDRGEAEERFIFLMMRVFSKENENNRSSTLPDNEQLFNDDEIVFIRGIANQYPDLANAFLEFFNISFK